MLFNPTGFNKLDFDEAKKTAALVGFDITTYARTKKSCGPGCDYLVNDKRYYVSMLLKHLEAMEQRESRPLIPEVAAWYAKAKSAAEEYREIEKRVLPLPWRD
jgi:hypothetical protein